MKDTRGTTLIEMLFIAFLVGTVLTVVAQIFRDYSRILSTSQKRNEIREAADHFSFLLQRDALSSFRILNPAQNGSSSNFECRIYHPREERFDSPGGWSRDSASDTLQVAYLLNGDKLLRRVGTEDEELLENVESTQYSLANNDLLTARVVLKNTPKSTVLEYKIFIPVRRIP